MSEHTKYVLPPGAVIFHRERLHPRVRAGLPAGNEDHSYVVTRPRSRKGSRLVTRPLAILLSQFRHPATIVDAVIAGADLLASTPDEVLEHAYLPVREFIDSGFLLPADAVAVSFAHALPDGLGDGSYRAVATLASTDDTQLIKLDSPGGRALMLKWVSSGAASWIRQALRREAAVLAHLDGAVAPRLVDQSLDRDDPWVLMEWVDGVSGDEWAQAVRSAAATDGLDTLLRGAERILDAYADLHDHGVLHGDVHPKNLLISARDLTVTIIDFGFAVVPASRLGAPHVPRGGLPEYFAPSFARAELDGRRAPELHAADEQYSVGALVYRLLTGHSYLRPTLDATVLMRRIADDPPRPFRSHGVVPPPAAEHAVRSALSKDLDGRFATLRAFRRAFGHRPVDRPVAARATGRHVLTGVGPTASQLFVGFDITDVTEKILSECGAGLNFGVAGLAYGLTRLGTITGSDDVLASAAYALARMESLDLGDARLFFPPALELSPASIDVSSLFHGAPGVDLSRAVAHLALGDYAGMHRAIESFVTRCDVDTLDGRKWDLATGSAGLLLGLAAVREMCRSTPLLKRIEIRGADLARQLLGALSHWRPEQTGERQNYFGAAHGAGGVATALLRWSEATMTPAPPELRAGLDRLAATSGRNRLGQTWWPRFPGDKAPWTGWCHGGAGHVLLWVQAARVFNERRYLDLAITTGRWLKNAARAGSEHLCCGRAGVLYAFASLYRATGDAAWLDEARHPYGGAPAAEPSSVDLRWSLYKGSLGLALAEADLGDVVKSAMPLVESEGWRPLSPDR